ncbi:hypothetical protein [Halorhabdus salina]|uniref:hypothetical protein n=1 Tax=Halorhabdus salina TaxID=2750670 RepID=UPI0015EE49D3|nr:hypothetical protein [Halorhabdus salina]
MSGSNHEPVADGGQSQDGQPQQAQGEQPQQAQGEQPQQAQGEQPQQAPPQGGQQGQQAPQGQQYQQGGVQQPPGQPGYGQGMGGSTLGPDFQKFGKLGLGAYLSIGLGTLVLLFLASTLAGESTSGVAGISIASEQALFVASYGAFEFTFLLSPLLAIGLGFFVGQRASAGSSPPAVGAAVNGGAVLATLLVLAVFYTLFKPETVSTALPEFGDLLTQAIAVAIGAAVIGAAGGALSERFERW